MTLARKIKNNLFLAICVLMMAVSVLVLFSVLSTLVIKGLTAVNWQLFTESTPPPGSAGGLANAIFGSLIMTAIAIAIATPLGILSATYLVEYGFKNKLAYYLRLLNDTLLSAPSIIVGLFIYATVVVAMGHYSAIAGALALAVIALPIVTRTVEDMLALLPMQLREAGVALGISRWRVTVMILYRAALQGILTAVLLATARILGETAPLLFTALNNQFWSTDLTQPMANLPVVIFQYALSPYDQWQQLAWGGAFLITLFILLLSLLTRFLFNTKVVKK
jgi:phosphate transport system permease protein